MPELFEDNLIPIKTLADIFLPEEGAISPETGQSLFNPNIVGGIITGGSFRSSSSGARLEIFPSWDPTIGMIVYNAASSQTFKIEVDGTNTGDITIGDYASNKGILWDNSASTFNIKGTITATAGDIGGWNIVSGYIYNLVSGTPTSSPSDGIVMASGNEAIIVYENTEKRVEVGYLSAGIYGIRGYADDGSTVIFELSDTQKYFNGAYLGANTVASAAVKPSLRGSSHNLVFSATDADTVSWASGTITLSDGTSYSINAGNTGNMAARTYVYLDPDTSGTALGVTVTMGTAVGESKILIASAENGTGEATFYVVGGIGGINIDADSIIVANLAAIKADLGSITAGNITLDSSGYIKGGQTAYNVGTGFFLGYDTSAYKFSIGTAVGSYMTWDGSILQIAGSLIGDCFRYYISADVYYSDDTAEGQSSATYVEKKEFTLPANMPTQTLRMYFELKGDLIGGGIIYYGRIYRNDVAYGTERSTGQDSYQPFTEDLEFTGGDTIQLMVKTNTYPDRTPWVQNFRILGTVNLKKYDITTTS